MANWPTGVPYKPLAGSWSMPEPFPAPIETEMEGGNVRKRRRPGDNFARIEFRIAMTREEWDTLFSWMKSDISNGTQRFTMQVWLGSSFVSKTVQFAPQFIPSAAEHGRAVAVTMNLRVYGA